MDNPFNVGIIMRYYFDTPPERVYRTYTDPKLIPEWWGHRCLKTRVDKMDLKPGGSWRFIQQDENETEFAFHGVYQEVVSFERLVFTFEFERIPGHSLLKTLTFEELDGRTQLTDKMLFQSTEDRDRMLNAGIEEAAAETMQRFAELLATNKLEML